MVVWIFIWMSLLICTSKKFVDPHAIEWEHFKSIQLNATAKLIVIKCSNFLSKSSLWISYIYNLKNNKLLKTCVIFGKAPSCSISTKNVNFYENAMFYFHLTCRNGFLELVYIYLDTKITKIAYAEAEICNFNENGWGQRPFCPKSFFGRHPLNFWAIFSKKVSKCSGAQAASMELFLSVIWNITIL